MVKFFALLALPLAFASLTPTRAETVLRCETVEEAAVIRYRCEQAVVMDSFQVPMPDLPPPLVTDPVIAAPAVAPPAPAAISPTPIVSLPQIPTPPQPDDAFRFSSDEMLAAARQLRTNPRLDRKLIDEVGAVWLKQNRPAQWTSADGFSAQGKALNARLSAAADEGLMASRYQFANQPEAASRAVRELAMNAAAVLYARDVSIGRVTPGLVHPLATPNRIVPSADDILDKLATSANVDATLSAYHPPHPDYHRLIARLKSVRAKSGVPFLADLTGPDLRMGMQDDRVPELRRRLGLPEGVRPVFDRPLVLAITRVQRDSGLPLTGTLNAQTIALAKAGGVSLQQENDIIANLEMWRWLPRTLGDAHVFVNIPSQALVMRKGDKAVFQTRTIIGTFETQTPIFSHQMDHIVVNPSWFVPPSILEKDPRYSDPEWTKAQGYTLRQRGETITVRVPPGPRNALGYVKFMFPNDHAVYLHDTPQRGKFASRYRALSNGCVRVENPFRLAAAIFAGEGWSEERFKRMIGGGEQRMDLSRKLPIHLAYMTIETTEGGDVIQHPDVYGHIRRLGDLLARP